MRSFGDRLKKVIPNRQQFLRSATALLIILLFSSYVGHALSSQSVLLPENPIDAPAEKKSQVALAGDLKHLMKTEEKKDGNIDKQTENSKEKEVEKEEKTEQVKNKGPEKNVGKVEKEQQAPLERKEETGQENGQRNTQENGANKDEPTSEKKDSPQDVSSNKNGNSNPESLDLEIKGPEKIDNDDENKGKNEYFTTTIMNDEVVTKEDYSFIIQQKEHNYRVEKVKVFINDEVVTDFRGNVKLVEGKNGIMIEVTYVDEEQKVFTASKEYTVSLKIHEVIIYSDLKNNLEVTKDNLIFTANAESNGEGLPLSVHLNGEKVQEERKNHYNVTLSTGENQITLSASSKSGKKKEETYVFIYDEKETELKITTDLKDQEVSVEKLSFNAMANHGKEAVELSVEHNDKAITGDSKGNYPLVLEEGKNNITLKAQYGEKSLVQKYEVIYAKPMGDVNEDEVEVDVKAPTLVTDLEDGLTIKGTIKTFNIWPVDYKGKRIQGSNVSVTSNGSGVQMIWDDSSKTSYKLDLKDGKNEVIIRVWDDEGRTTTETFYVNGIMVEEGAVIGKATISLEATTIGLGALIPEMEIEIHQGERTSYILDQLLRDNGFEYEHTGNLDSSFYLAAIGKPNLVTNPSIPTDLADILQREMERFDEADYGPDWLGEFDFSNGSGWMYSVNGDYPNFGFADSYLNDGDVVRIRFTLAYGSDIGGFDSAGTGPGGNWHKEW